MYICLFNTHLLLHGAVLLSLQTHMLYTQNNKKSLVLIMWQSALTSETGLRVTFLNISSWGCGESAARVEREQSGTTAMTTFASLSARLSGLLFAFACVCARLPPFVFLSDYMCEALISAAICLLTGNKLHFLGVNKGFSRYWYCTYVLLWPWECACVCLCVLQEMALCGSAP